MGPFASATVSTTTAAAPTPQPRLVRAAHEFEAQMMKELIKPLNQGNGIPGSYSDDDDSGSAGALGEVASEALGRALSDGGGFGIASSIVRQLTNPGHQGKTAPVTTNLHRDTVINSHQ